MPNFTICLLLMDFTPWNLGCVACSFAVSFLLRAGMKNIMAPSLPFPVFSQQGPVARGKIPKRLMINVWLCNGGEREIPHLFPMVLQAINQYTSESSWVSFLSCVSFHTSRSPPTSLINLPWSSSTMAVNMKSKVDPIVGKQNSFESLTKCMKVSVVLCTMQVDSMELATNRPASKISGGRLSHILSFSSRSWK